MSIQLSKEQLMLQREIRKFSRKVIAEHAQERDKTKEFPAENFKRMAELGLMGMLVPTEYGGEGFDTISYLLALSEIAYSCASTAVVMSVHNSIVCESVAKFGTEEQKKKYLPDLTKVKMIGAFALTEPEAGSDPLGQKTTAVKDGDHYIINGDKRFITSGKNGGLVIVTAKTDETKAHKGISAFIVTKDNPGFKVGNIEDKMGLRASDTTDLIFNNCRVHKDDMLGKEGEGFKIAMVGLDAGRLGIAAQSIGVAQASLDEAVKYAKQREQFGQKISKFQGLRWIIADMAVEIEAARALMLLAAAKKDAGERYTLDASITKLFASEMVNRLTAKALQIHGGYGFTKEYPVERFYRDARVFTIYEGTSEIQRLVISNNILNDK